MSGGSPVEIMFIVLCTDISLILRTCEISLHKTIHMISTGDLLFTCSCYNILSTEHSQISLVRHLSIKKIAKLMCGKHGFMGPLSVLNTYYFSLNFVQNGCPFQLLPTSIQLSMATV